jgi:ABC-2 type transport system ATP-binding protein
MPETESFIAGMSAVRFVRMMAELAGLPAKAALERTHETLFYVGLGEARYRKLETYSLGMKQLAKLAQAIVHGPEVVFLDEPTNGLDPAALDRMLRLIREVADAGVRVILSSHLLRDVESCCDEVIVLRQGRVATIANLAAERQAPALPRVEMKETRGGDAAAFLADLARLGCEVAELANRRAKIVLPEGVESRRLWALAEARGLQLRRLTVARNSLEHVFLKAMEATDDAGGSWTRRGRATVPVYDRRYRGYAGERRDSAGVSSSPRATPERPLARGSLILYPRLPAAARLAAPSTAPTTRPVGRRRVSREQRVALAGWRSTGRSLVHGLAVEPGVPARRLRHLNLVAPDLALTPCASTAPSGRAEYVAGSSRRSPAASAVTWVPGLLLVGLQTSLAGTGWLAANWRLVPAMVVGFALWIVLLALFALAISAWVKWRPVATGMLFGVFIVGEAFGKAIVEIVGIRWGKLLAFDDLVERLGRHVRHRLLGVLPEIRCRCRPARPRSARSGCSRSGCSTGKSAPAVSR